MDKSKGFDIKMKLNQNQAHKENFMRKGENHGKDKNSKNNILKL